MRSNLGFLTAQWSKGDWTAYMVDEEHGFSNSVFLAVPQTLQNYIYKYVLYVCMHIHTHTHTYTSQAGVETEVLFDELIYICS